jgi:hypothetical protein
MDKYQETLQKLAKWYRRAEECLDRNEVKKILKKAKKHSKRLSGMDSKK